MADKKKKFDKDAKQWILLTCISRDVSLVYCKPGKDTSEVRVIYHSGKDIKLGSYEADHTNINAFLDSIYERMNGYKAKDYSDLIV